MEALATTTTTESLIAKLLMEELTGIHMMSTTAPTTLIFKDWFSSVVFGFHFIIG